MTAEEFKAFIAGDCAGGWADLEPWLAVEPCDCGEQYCQGWQTRIKVDRPR